MRYKGKEYDKEGKIIFEGEYLDNKKWNGKIKEYYINKLIFEGVYLYGHRYKGKEYHNGKLEYEGEYLFDRKWDGKEYDENGNIINEIKNGMGTVKEYDKNDKLIYQGEYLNGQIWKDKKIYYYSYYINNKKENENDYLQIEEDYLNRKANPKLIVKIFINNVLKFVGDYLNEKKDENHLYSNRFGFNKVFFTGEGKEYFNNGKLYFEGEYLKGNKWNGKIYSLENNKISEIKNGTIEYTKEYDIEGDLEFEGTYVNGVKTGFGKLYEKIKYRGNILIFEGNFLDGINRMEKERNIVMKV